MRDTNAGPRLVLRILCLALLAMALFVTFPGRTGPDENDMLRQAAEGYFHDWHSPLIARIMALGMRIAPGTAPIDVLELVLYFLGVYLLANAALRQGHRIVAFAIAVLSVFPLTNVALAAAGSKDVFTTALLLIACGIFARTANTRTPPLAALAILLLGGLTILVRPNALFAILPLFICLAWQFLPGRPTPRAIAATGIAAITAIALTAGLLVFNRTVLATERSNVLAALMIFDIAGMTTRSGTDAADGLFGPDFEAAVPECYVSREWDRYAIWGACPEVWVHLFGREMPIPTKGEEWAGYFSRALMERPGNAEAKTKLTGQWLRAVAAHPIAYAAHRVDYLANATGLVGGYGEMNWVNIPSLERPGAVEMWQASKWVGDFPFMRPWAWMLLGLVGTIWTAFLRASPARTVAFLLMSSGFVYGAGYLIFGVASLYRYFHWTILAEAMGTAWLFAAMVVSTRRSAAVSIEPTMAVRAP